MAEATKPYINDAGTVILATDDQYRERYKPAGYRPLKEGERIPIQQSELDAGGPGIGQGVALADPPSPDAIKKLRREHR